MINFTGLIFQTSSYVALFQPVNCEFWDIGSRNISFFRLAETHIQIEGHCQCRGKKYPANSKKILFLILNSIEFSSKECLMLSINIKKK